MKTPVLVFLIVSVFSVSGCVTASHELDYRQRFSVSGEYYQRPVKVFVSERELEKNGNIFLLMADTAIPMWGPNESEWQVTRYNINENSDPETIYKIQAEQGILYESASSESFICWLIIMADASCVLYIYDIEKSELTHDTIIDDFSKIANFPMSLVINNAYAAWIEHNSEEETSAVKLLGIKDKQLTTVEAAPYSTGDIPVAVFSCELSDDTVFYDFLDEDGNISIVQYDLNTMSRKNSTPLDPVNGMNIKLDYGASFDVYTKQLALYAQSDEGDFIYTFNPENGSTDFVQKVSGGIIYHDKLKYLHNVIYYSLANTVSADLLSFVGHRVDAGSGEDKTLDGCYFYNGSEHYLASLSCALTDEELFSDLIIHGK